MADAVILTSFAGGELATNLYARVDLDKYHVGAALLQNFFVDYRGGVSNRPGTSYVDIYPSVFEPSQSFDQRCIPFIVDETQSYVCVFMPGLIYIYRDRQRVNIVSTSYAREHLFELRYEQSADVMTITHPAYGISNLIRLSATEFTIEAVTIGPVLSAPAGLTATASVGGALKYAYTVTAVSPSGEESLAATIVTETSAALDPTNATPRTIALNWTATAGAQSYNIYKAGPVEGAQADPTVLGFIGQSTDNNFIDNNIGPDFAIIPPDFIDPFADDANPTCISYYQQRRVYGGANITPTVIDMSQTGHYNNFDVSPAVLDSDAISINIASRQVNRVKHLVAMQTGLIAFTNGNTFLIAGGDSGITPTNVSVTPQPSTGAGNLRPIVINNNVLFNSYQSTTIRDLTFNFQTSSYYGEDRSRLANHLFFGRSLIDWAWAEDPFKILWVVRDDGKLLSMTYLPEQEVYGWGRHETQGLFQSVCSIPEGNEDAVYVIVRRFLNGEWANYLERFQSRVFDCASDTWFLDCGIDLLRHSVQVGAEVSVSGDIATLTLHEPSSIVGVPGPTIYGMEAKENYDPARVTLIEAGDFPTPTHTDAYMLGYSYDHVNRKLRYCVIIEFNASGLNTTGFTLWDGQTAIAPGGAINLGTSFNMWLAEKDIDTGVVTFFNTYSAAKLVPAGIGGGDGTWRRYTSDTQHHFNSPNITDPRTGDYWVHAESCELYVYRAADNYALALSPYRAPGSAHVIPMLLSTAWMICYEEGGSGVGDFIAHFIPRLLDAPQIADDELLSYADYAFPIAVGTNFFITAGTANGNVYMLSYHQTGVATYKLYKLTKPTSAPHGGPVVGGGWTDVTPWAVGTGPNAAAVGYTFVEDPKGNRAIIYRLTNELTGLNDFAILTWVYMDEIASTDYLDTKMALTVFRSSAGTFAQTDDVVVGLMKADWTAAANLDEAVYAVTGMTRHVNPYLECNDFVFSDIEYDQRWIYFDVHPVVNGEVFDGLTKVVMVLYEFSFAGGATVLTVIDEQGWDAAYPVYGMTVDDGIVVEASLYQDDIGPDILMRDRGVYDPQSRAFWWSGEDFNVYNLNPLFAYRQTRTVADPPLLRIALDPTVDDMCVDLGCVGGTILSIDNSGVNPVWTILLDAPLTPIPYTEDTYPPLIINEWFVGSYVTQMGMPHLVGETVGLVLDGIIQETQVVDENGAISWEDPTCRGYAGLPYVSRFQSLKLDIGDPTIQGKRKVIPAVTVRVDHTAGATFGTYDFNTMYQSKTQADSRLIIDTMLVIGQPVTLFSCDLRINVDAGWETNGVLTAEQTYPMPVTILGLIPEVTVGDNMR